VPEAPAGEARRRARRVEAGATGSGPGEPGCGGGWARRYHHADCGLSGPQWSVPWHRLLWRIEAGSAPGVGCARTDGGTGRRESGRASADRAGKPGPCRGSAGVEGIASRCSGGLWPPVTPCDAVAARPTLPPRGSVGTGRLAVREDAAGRAFVARHRVDRTVAGIDLVVTQPEPARAVEAIKLMAGDGLSMARSACGRGARDAKRRARHATVGRAGTPPRVRPGPGTGGRAWSSGARPPDGAYPVAGAGQAGRYLHLRTGASQGPGGPPASHAALRK
jgi:hypothetical protein